MHDGKTRNTGPTHTPAPGNRASHPGRVAGAAPPPTLRGPPMGATPPPPCASAVTASACACRGCDVWCRNRDLVRVFRTRVKRSGACAAFQALCLGLLGAWQRAMHQLAPATAAATRPPGNTSTTNVAYTHTLAHTTLAQWTSQTLHGYSD